MTGPQPPDDPERKAPDDEDDDGGNRTVENMVLAGFFIALVAAGIWLLGTMADVRKTEDCMLQGRRNCQPIEVPDRSR